jgi:D-alanine-D-alanine ligase-like ATP-grasp enzyme
MEKVQVLQGLNLEADLSTIKIKVNKTEELIQLLKTIKAYHPIFTSEYFFEEGTLIIRSNIPFFWKDIAETLVKLSKEEITYEEAKDICNTTIKERLSSMTTIPLLHATHKLGLETTPTILKDNRVEYTKSYNRHYTLGTGKNSHIIYSISSSKDSKIAKEIQKDKWSSNLMIERLGLPIPKWEVVDNISDIERIWSRYQKPVVIKPTGLVGGHGVVLGIDSLEEAKKAFKFAKDACKENIGKDWQQKIMIQEQIKGEDYRLLVINGKLEIATKRIPAFIVGDGKHTIEEIIIETNKDPKRDISNPSHTLKPIIIDQPLKDYLKQQDLTLKSVPQKDQQIQVRKVASMSQGGITEDFTEKVGPEIKLIVESIASSIHAFALGVDVMCQDLSKPLTKENGAILEYNTMPEAYLNTYPVIGESREYVFEKYIKALTEGNKTKQIVVVGNPSEDIPTLLKQKSFFRSYLDSKDVVGEYRNGDIIINGLDINKGLEKWQAIEALKVNASLDVIIIHHRDWEDVKETGLGFNRINMLIIEKKMTDSKEFSLIKRLKRKGYINKIKII